MEFSLEDNLFGRNPAFELTAARGREWVGNVCQASSQSIHLGIALLLLDTHRLSARFEAGEVLSTFAAEISALVDSSGLDREAFETRLSQTLFRIVPGFHYEKHASDLDPSLALTLYGTVCDKLPRKARGHFVNPQAAIASSEVDVRGTVARMVGNFVGGARGLVGAIMPNPHLASERANEGGGRLNLDDIVATALRTVETYTAKVEAGEMHIDNAQGIAVFQTMSTLNSSLRLRTNEDCWADENEAILSRTDDIMVAFQNAVITTWQPPSPNVHYMFSR